MSFGQASSYDDQDSDEMSREGDEHAALRTDVDEFPIVATISESHDVGLTPTNDVGSSDAGISAFTAVSQYPNAFDNDSNALAVTEVVNAVIGREEYLGGEGRHFRAASVGRSSSPPADLYISDSETTDVLGHQGGVPIGPYMVGGRVPMDSILANDPALQHHFSTIPEESDEDDVGDLIMDYESPIPRGAFSVSDHEEDPDDTQKFYVDHDDDYYEENIDLPRTREATAQLTDVDFNDFYRGFDYDPLLVMEAAPTGNHGDHNNFPEGEATGGLPGIDLAHIPTSALHSPSEYSSIYP
jgi:hypothetical protein